MPYETVQMAGVRGALKQLVLGQADGVPNFSIRVFICVVPKQYE